VVDGFGVFAELGEYGADVGFCQDDGLLVEGLAHLLELEHEQHVLECRVVHAIVLQTHADVVLNDTLLLEELLVLKQTQLDQRAHQREQHLGGVELVHLHLGRHHREQKLHQLPHERLEIGLDKRVLLTGVGKVDAFDRAVRVLLDDMLEFDQVGLGLHQFPQALTLRCGNLELLEQLDLGHAHLTAGKVL